MRHPVRAMEFAGRRPRRASDRPEGGSALLLVAAALPVVLGFVGMAVDVRNGYVIHAVLQHAVDDGAETALRWAQQVDASTAGRAVGARALSEAVRVAQDDLAAQGVPDSRVTGAVVGDRLVLEAVSRIPTFFLSLFGVRFWTPQAHAEAPMVVPSGAAPLSLLPPSGSKANLVTPSVVPPPAFPPSPGDGGNNDTGGPTGFTGERVSPPQETGTGETPGPAASLGPCNCDGIAAGDPQTAREALDRMGVTPADPGPFQGDFTAEMGLHEMADTTDSPPGGDEGW